MKKQFKKTDPFDFMKILLFVPILIVTLFLTSCNSSSENKNQSADISHDSNPSFKTQNAALDSVVQNLLDASAKDFHDHQPPVPVRFRNVQIKFFAEKSYLICGQFLAKEKQDKEDWTPFATIKTSGYEQWIGSNSLSYCQDSKVIAYKISDLSAILKSRFDSLQNLAK